MTLLRSLTVFALSSLLLAGLLIGCSSADHPTAPPSSVLSITASSTKIGLNGSANITVSGFRPDGNPLAAGTLIRFSTSLGSVNPAVTEIGADGFARAVFSADGRAGSATVTANLSTGSGGGGTGSGDGGGSGTGTGAESASVTIEVSEEKPSLLINANPSIVDIGEISLVTITARDENDLPLGPGENILLTVDLGELLKNGQPVTQVQTEADGRATVDFLAGNEAGTGVVEALLRNSDQVTVTIEIREAPDAIDLTPSDTTIASSGGTLTLTATVTSANSKPVSQVAVTFFAELGTLANGVVLTDNAGSADTTLTVSQTDIDSFAGSSFRVNASFTFDGQTRQVERVINIGGGAGG